MFHDVPLETNKRARRLILETIISEVNHFKDSQSKKSVGLPKSLQNIIRHARVPIVMFETKVGVVVQCAEIWWIFVCGKQVELNHNGQ